MHTYPPVFPFQAMDPFAGAYDRYGAGSTYTAAPSAAAPEIARGGLTANAPVWHPDNPLFWFGAVILAAFGLVGFATEFRAGPARAGLTLGDT